MIRISHNITFHSKQVVRLHGKFSSSMDLPLANHQSLKYCSSILYTDPRGHEVYSGDSNGDGMEAQPTIARSFFSGICKGGKGANRP